MDLCTSYVVAPKNKSPDAKRMICRGHHLPHRCLMAELVLSPILQAFVQQVVGDGVGSLRHKLAASKSLEETFKLLTDVVESLNALMEDCEAQVKTHPSKITTKSYDLWNTRVLGIGNEVEGIRNDYYGRTHKNFLRRSKFRDVMANKCLNCVQLLQDGCSLAERGFLVDKPPEPVVKLNAPDIQGFPTLEIPLGNILKSLKHGKIQVIAIHGMVGVGKTTVMLNLNNHEETANLFDMVIWVKLPTKGNEMDLRQAIAQRLELDKKGITNPDSSTISRELKDNKCLLLLDDVTRNLDFSETGIPMNNGSKVVFTTRYRPLCKLMADKIIPLQPLSAEEAWKMFREITADAIHLPNIEPIARLVANKCARLPLLLKAVASSFKLKDNAALWRVGLKNLQRWPEAGIQGVKEMYEFLKFCYDELKDDTARQCFVYGALFPADSKIYTNYLLECWTAEGFFDNIVNAKSYRAMCDAGYDILNHLTEVSLMEKGDKMIYVLMNNCIQEFALHLLSEHSHHKVVVESQSVEEWQQANRISLIGDKLCNLPESSNCSALLTLLLQRNSKLVTIPPLFFENMGCLVVLDLSGAGIESLPPSVADLSALKALYLNDCILLKELPPEIAKLGQLEVLDIQGSRINFIPRQIQYLSSLRSLRMSYNKFCERGDNQEVQLGHGMISKLAKLEELIINVIFYRQWCTEVVDVVRQVAGLRNLTTLRFCFPKTEHLKTFMEINSSWRDHLSSFRFFIGCPNLKRPPILQQFEYKIDKYLRYCDGDLNDKHIICETVAASEVLELIGHKDITTLSDFMRTGRFENVRGLLIQRCNQIETIVHGGGNAEDGRVLPVLEQLYLRNMYSLKYVFGGQLKLESLSRLQILELKDCPKLTAIFSNGVIKQLSELRKLTVEECGVIEELIMEAGGGGSGSEPPLLQKLETLKLVNLPKLRTICADQSRSWPSLEMVEIDNCPEFKTFPFNKDNAARLRYITGKREWWEALQWRDTEVKKQLERICSLRL